jgi:Ca2+-binding RTX toxin-like protein
MIGSSKDDPDQLFVTVNGARSYFSRQGITAISVDLGGGDDAFAFYDESGLVNLPATINGGAGDDEMGGEGDRDFMDHPIQIGDGPFAPLHLIGGEGNDSLGGALGDTFAEGGPGNDTMRGLGKAGYGNNGAFTILDAPTPEGSIHKTIDAGDNASTGSTSPSLPAPPASALPATLEDSLLISEPSLLGDHADEIW